MTGSPILRFGMIVLSVLMCGGFLYAIKWTDGRGSNQRYLVKSAAVITIWLALTGVAASRGVLSFSTLPPTMFVMLAAAFALTVWTAFSQVGTRLATMLPLSALVGFQSFRIVVEVWLHRGYEEGLFPVQMTYSGLNFDIVSGITAAIVAALLVKGSSNKLIVQAWNLLGLALLTTIVVIAVLSAPVPFRVFDAEPANVWVTDFPGVWLPAVLVQMALFGHLLVFRRLFSIGTDKPHSKVG